MTLRDLMGTGAPEVEVTGLAYASDTVRPGSLFFCVRGFTADGHDFAPDAVRAGRGRAGGRAPARAGRARGRGARRAGGDGAGGRALQRRPDRRPAGGWHHRHERQDHHGVPGPRDPRGSRHAAPGCWAPSSRSSAGWRSRSSARRPRRSTFRPPSGGCWTPATPRARWRCRRTRSSSGARRESASRRRSSPTSPRITSTSTRRWRTTTWPSAGCSTSRGRRW